MGQAGCGEQKPLELALLPLAAFSAWPLTLHFLPYSRILMPKGPWVAFVPGPTGLSEEKRQENSGSMSMETLLPNGCLSSALGRDFQANVSWVEAIYTEGKGLPCRRSAFPSSGDTHGLSWLITRACFQVSFKLPGACKWQKGMFCSLGHRPVDTHCMVPPTPT